MTADGLAAPADDIIDTLAADGRFTELLAAIDAAAVASTLREAGPYTLFAPTDDAFAALPAGTVESLLKPENKDQLTKILTCHVVPAKALAADVVKMAMDAGGTAQVDTVGGCKLSIKAEGGSVTITDEAGGTATVTIADVLQSNGVIHVIDKVLLPKT